ncbi:unnamed protein product, partial [Mesorhabditis spiculigera]
MSDSPHKSQGKDQQWVVKKLAELVGKNEKMIHESASNQYDYPWLYIGSDGHSEFRKKLADELTKQEPRAQGPTSRLSFLANHNHRRLVEQHNMALTLQCKVLAQSEDKKRQWWHVELVDATGKPYNEACDQLKMKLPWKKCGCDWQQDTERVGGQQYPVPGPSATSWTGPGIHQVQATQQWNPDTTGYAPFQQADWVPHDHDEEWTGMMPGPSHPTSSAPGGSMKRHRFE